MQQIKVFSQRNYGKGKAVQLGISKATGEHVVVQDSDLEYLPNDIVRMCKATKNLNPYHNAIHLQIKAYLENKIKSLNFACLPEGSRFQKTVWYEIKKIGYGKKRSYLEISKKIKSSPRAVGNACSTNPCLFFIPCHRVICNNGSIGGYIMGTRIKKQLLINEFKL